MVYFPFSLDYTLNDGFVVGNIYEICGPSAIGKSQLCMSIASSIVYKYGVNVHFIDSGGNFSAKRVSEILASKACNDVGNIYLKIKYKLEFI